MNNLRNLAIWIVLALLLVFLFNLVQGTAQHASAQNITYTKFVDEVNQGQVKAVTMQGDAIKGIEVHDSTDDLFAAQKANLDKWNKVLG